MKFRHALYLAMFSSLGVLSGCTQTPTTPEPSPESQVISPSIQKSVPLAMTAEPSNSTNIVVRPTYYNYETSDMSIPERKALLDLLDYLQQARVLIKSAQAQQSEDQRIKFRYDWLTNDLYKISRGISDHLSSPESQARTVQPIMGEYRR